MKSRNNMHAYYTQGAVQYQGHVGKSQNSKMKMFVHESYSVDPRDLAPKPRKPARLPGLSKQVKKK